MEDILLLHAADDVHEALTLQILIREKKAINEKRQTRNPRNKIKKLNKSKIIEKTSKKKNNPPFACRYGPLLEKLTG